MSNAVFPDVLPGVDIKVSREVEYDVRTLKSISNKETRFTWETFPRYRYTLDFNILRANSAFALRANEFQQLFQHVASKYGSLDNFLYTDPDDSVANDCGFAIADGVSSSFQMQRALAGATIDASGYEYNTYSKPYTNLVKNSSFETDTNADGLSDNWNDYNNSSATEPNTHLVVPGMNGGKAQRISWGTNTTSTKGVFQGPIGWKNNQWYTISFFARATGSNVGKWMTHNWSAPFPTHVEIQVPPLTTSWQRYVFQVFWTTAQDPSALNLWLTINNSATGSFQAGGTLTFGDLDFDLVQVTTGQWGANDLQPIETPAATTSTRNPALWPAFTDGFEPVFDLNGDATIFADGYWQGRQQLYPWARTNLVQKSELVDQWTRVNTFISPNVTTAPDGNATADAVGEGQPPGAPTLNTLTPSTTGGTIATSTVFVKVAALNANAEESLPSGELSTAVTGPTASVAVAWSAPVGGSAPTGYRVYVGTATGTEGQFFLPGNVTSFTVTTLTGTAGTPKTTTAVQHFVNTIGVPAEVAGELRCWSVFLKANTLPNVLLSEPGSSVGIKFNLGTGIIDGNSDGAIVASGVITSPLWPGWYRVWFTRRTGASGTALFVQGCADATYSTAGYTGTARSFFCWGGMCERTSNLNGPTPYIATPGAAAVTVTDYTLSSTGIVTFPNVPAIGMFFSWSGAYYRRVRFEDNKRSAARLAQYMWESKSVNLISVKP